MIIQAPIPPTRNVHKPWVNRNPQYSALPPINTPQNAKLITKAKRKVNIAYITK